MSVPPIDAPLDRAQRVALGVLVGAMAFSVAGSLALRAFPVVASWIGAYYVTLVKAPTWTYMAALPVLAALLYAPLVGWPRTLRLAAIGSVVGGAAELLGTSTGVPFGEYVYTAWLGPKFLGHVPYLIPASWFAMSIVCYDFAGRIAGRPSGRIVITAVLMTAWDVSLDPAMSSAFPFWTYPGGGSFFGMPLSNWIGWFAVSGLIAACYEWLGGGPVPAHPRAGVFYAVNCLFPILLSLVYGLPWAAAVGLAVTALVLATVRRSPSGPHADLVGS